MRIARILAMVGIASFVVAGTASQYAVFAADLPPIVTSGTTPSHEPPTCTPALERVTVNNLRSVWCRAVGHAPYEVRRDMERKPSGRPWEYLPNSTVYLDCQDSVDWASLYPTTRCGVCPQPC